MPTSPTPHPDAAGESEFSTDSRFWHEERSSVEVWRWGAAVRLAIRSEDSKGKAIELSLEDAERLIQQLNRCVRPVRRPIRDEPQA